MQYRPGPLPPTAGTYSEMIPSGSVFIENRRSSSHMQYFKALSVGRKRVALAREYLNGIADGRAMPALALADADGNSWNPVSEESLYAFVNEAAGFVLTDDSGYILAMVDPAGYSKAVVQGVTDPQRKMMEARLQADGIPEYRGKVILPV